MNKELLPVNVQTYRFVRPKLDVQYPLIAELPDSPNYQEINKAISAEVGRMIHQQGYPQNPKTESSGYYELKTNERRILSLSLFNYAFSGGAHGMTLQKSLTFDVNAGKLVSLREVFKPGTDYVNKLSAIVQAQIQARNINLLEPFKRIRPDQDFYIADKALVLYFQLYEITAYVYGFQYFPVSVYEIQEMIDEEGPLGKMIY